MLAYCNDFVATIYHQNKPLREFNKKGKRTCVIPFGGEYSLKLKNKSINRVQVEIEIDGTDILFGKRLILNPMQDINLERFVNDLEEGSKFKFISINQAEKEGQLQDPDSPDNGHIKIKVYQEINYNWTSWTTFTFPETYTYTSSQDLNNPIKPTGISNFMATNSGVTTGTLSNSTPLTQAYCSTVSEQPKKQENVGVTVEGGGSNQKFYEEYTFSTGFFPNTTIDIWLEGPSFPKEQKSEQNKKCSKLLYEKYILPGLKKDASEKEVADMKEWYDVFLKTVELEK